MKYTERYRYLPITSVKSYRYYRYRLPVGQKLKLKRYRYRYLKNNFIYTDIYRLSIIGVPIVIGRYRLPYLPITEEIPSGEQKTAKRAKKVATPRKNTASPKKRARTPALPKSPTP